MIDAPQSIPNLVDRLPPDYLQPVIIAKYNVAAQKPPYLLCAHCGTHHHWKGYILSLPDGKHALLAERHCGRKQFGLIWGAVQNLFARVEERQTSLRRLIEIRRLFLPFKDEVLGLSLREELVSYDAFLKRLGQRFGKLARQLGNGPKRDGRLDAIIQVRDSEAEDRQARKRVPDIFEDIETAVDEIERGRAYRSLQKWIDDYGKVYKPQAISMGICSGHRVLELEKPSALLHDALQHLNDLESIFLAESFEGWTNKQFADAFTALRRVFECVDTALQRVNDMSKFTHPENLARIVAWATRHQAFEGKVRAEGRNLVDADGEILEGPTMPDKIETPALTAMLRVLGK